MKLTPSSPSPLPGAVTGILLAAGRGRRFDATGRTNKLLAPLSHGAEIGLPIAFVAARRLRAALPPGARLLAVIDAAAPRAQELRDWLTRAGCEVTASAHAAQGMGASLADAIRASLAPAPVHGDSVTERAAARQAAATQQEAASHSHPPAIHADPGGWIVALADMPRIAPATIQQVIASMTDRTAIAAPVFDADGSLSPGNRAADPVDAKQAARHGLRGHPVGFGGAHREALLALTGDAGARSVIELHGFTAIPTRDAGVLSDIDTPADL